MGANRWGGLTLSLMLGFAASARDTVTWYIDPSLPPAHIASGPYAGTGIIDRELNWLIASLPQFDHLIVESTATRTWHEIGRTDARCSPAALKLPEREKMAVFSAPALMSWGIMLIVRKDRVAAMRSLYGPSETVDLARLIASDSLRGVVNKGRSYGPLIDPLIVAPGARKSVLSVSDSLQGLRMVASGRADYAIGYSYELSYFRKIDGSQEPIIILPIEGVNRYVTGFIACTDQPAGRAVVAAVNEALARDGTPPPYVQQAQQWLNDKEFGEVMASSRWTEP